MDSAEAKAFAEEWVAAWNAHDLERVLAHYAEDIVFLSPIAKQRTGEGRVVGKAALKRYWGPALAAIGDLHFELGEVLTGFEGLTILYRNQRGQLVAETFEFAAGGKVVRACACYQDQK